MVKSMTGYGRAEETFNGCTITVELRSVNNRYLDCNVRIPRLYLFAEDAIKTRVQDTISRGKVDVFVTLDSTGAEKMQVSVNKPMADGYYTALKKLAEDYSLTDDISVSLLSRFPEVLLAEKAEEDVEQMAKDICSVLDRALADFDQMRTREGERLKADVLARAAIIEDKVALVEQRSPQTVAEYRAKPDPHRGGHLRRQGGGGRRDRPPAQPHRPAPGNAGQRGRHRPEAGLPDSGVQPGGQHHRLQVQRSGDLRPCGGYQGGD